MVTQLDIENENLQIMLTKGINELQQAKETGTISNLKYSGAVVPYYVGGLANSLKLYSDQVLMGKAKIKALPAKMLTVLDPLVVSHYTVKCIVDSVGKKYTSIVSLSTKLAGYLNTEYRISLMEEDSQKSFSQYIQQTGYKNDRQFKITRDLLDKYEKEITKTNLSFYKLASKSILLLSEIQPIVKNKIMPPICFVNEKKGIETRIEVASWFTEWLSEMVTKNDGMVLPEYHTPLIEEPIPWTSRFGGGFHSPRFKYNLVKTTLDSSEFTTVPSRTMAAVNRLQGTKWRINSRVLEVMQAACDNDLGWGGLPTPYNAKDYLTPCPHTDIDNAFLTEEQKADRKLWRRQSAPHYDEQESRRSKVLAMHRVVLEAKRFRDFDAIYFAYFCDFRGRIYPKASNLHPQGADYVKALLEFADAKPINTKEAEAYFYMQGANSYGHGLDKKTLAEKGQWVQDNIHSILHCAANPYDLNSLWHTADEDPWLFLAWCFEFKEFYDESHKGNLFYSRLPIAFDGSCNGLQHLSAILLDEVGGEAVNLTAKPVKQDIYDVVRGKTEKLLESNVEPLAADLLKFGISRKCCKRPVMIVPYAGTQRACRRYIKDQMIVEGGQDFFGDNLGEAVTLYTAAVWEAIGQTIVKGREVMNFLKDTAKLALNAQGGHTITWMTPNGFEVKQKITKVNFTSIKTPLGNTIRERGYIQNKLYVVTDEPNVRKHGTAIAPNLVHSLDACHLQETVNSMPDDTSFAMIHDSFGCHAHDAAALNHILRVIFKDMYVSGEFLQGFVKQLGIEVELPNKGSLDLNKVIEDEFFFS